MYDNNAIITYDILNYATLSIFESFFVKPMTEELQIKHDAIFLPNKNTFIDWHLAFHYGLHS
jgi:hypothetical protein